MKREFETPEVVFVTLAADDIMNLKSAESGDVEFLDYSTLQ